MSYGQPLTSVGKTLLGLENRLRIELGNRTDIDKTTLDEWINDSYIDLVNTLKLPSLRTSMAFFTTVGEESYILPAGVGTIHRVSWVGNGTVPEGGKLEKSDADEFRKLPPRTGYPLKVLRENGMLILWPEPDAVYSLTVDFTQQVQPLVQPTDSPLLDLEFHEPLFYGAKARGFEALGNQIGANTAYNNQTRLMRRKLDKEAENEEDKIPSMRPVSSYEEINDLAASSNQTTRRYY